MSPHRTPDAVRTPAAPLLAARRFLTRETVGDHGRTLHQVDENGWESFYRDRWRYDKVVRSTHGVNCTGSCSWNVFVKDGLITWEHQATDYPATGPDMPDHEPRGAGAAGHIILGCPSGCAPGHRHTEVPKYQNQKGINDNPPNLTGSSRKRTSADW